MYAATMPANPKDIPLMAAVKVFREYLEQKAVILDMPESNRFAVPYNTEKPNFGFSNDKQLREALRYLNIAEINIFDESNKKVRIVNLLDPNDTVSTYEEFMISNPHDTKLIVDFGLNA